MRHILRIVLGLGIMTGLASADSIVTFTLDPVDGFLSGSPGSAVGWGYDVSTSSGYVFVDYLGFDDLTPVGAQNLFAPPSTPASPGNDIVVPWIAGTSGFEYDIASTATPGSSTTGGVYLVYDEYQNYDPVDGPSDPIAQGVTVYATDTTGSPVTAEVLVSPTAVLPTPEPASVWLFAIAIGGLATNLLLHRRQAR